MGSMMGRDIMKLLAKAHTKGNSKMGNIMAKAFSNGRMIIIMKVNTRMELEMDKANLRKENSNIKDFG